MKFKRDVHSVKKFSVEVDYPDSETAKDAQDRIVTIIKSKIVDILDQSFKKYDKGLLVKINKLVLDLGDIPINELNTQFPGIFEKKINNILSGFNSNIYSTKEIDEVEVVDEEKQLISCFAHYLKYGAYPWYMQNVIGEYSFNEIFAYLIEKNDESFIDEFFNLLEYSNVRRRLVRFFDSGEVLQIFKTNLPTSFYDSIWALNKEISSILQRTVDVEGIYKTHLDLYLKEFILQISSKAKKSNQTLTLGELAIGYVEFVFNEKNIPPEKWLTSIFLGKVKQTNTNITTIVESIQKYYMNYLLDEKLSPILSKADKLTDKTQFYDWLLEKQPITGRYLSKAIEDIIRNIRKQYLSIEKSKLEQIIMDIASDIIPDILIAPENVDKWIYAINQQTSQMLGVSLEEAAKEKDRLHELDISIIKDYLSLFLKSGLLPFKRLYQDPQKVLKDLFQKYIDKEKEVKSFIKEQAERDSMIAWRVKEAFGDDFLTEHDIFPKKIEYDYQLLMRYIRTGAFPWPEIVDKGYDDLVERVMQFVSHEHRSKLSEILVEEDFFKKKIIMEKVFETMPVDFGKELLKIRKELVDKKMLDLSIDEKSKDSIDEDILDWMLVDGLANQIVDFSKRKTSDSLLRKKQANLIFDEIIKSARKSLYETASMLVSFEKGMVDELMTVFDSNQKDYIKKLGRNYRSRFLDIAEEIKESEKREEQIEFVDEETGDTYYINNAGLVLLNVYMKRLFDRFELLDKKEFKSNEAREKAVYILQYLVAKDNNPGEHELALNKVLVGIPLSVPLKFDIKITDEEKAICDNLLEAAIKNWSALKNTSIDGLRTSFLLRAGSLKKEEREWRLHVEKKTYDILLSKIPWGYTMIHFPWMDKPLFVDWGN